MIYFNQNKQAYAFVIADPLCAIEENVWKEYSSLQQGVEYDIDETGIIDLRDTPEYEQEQAQKERQRLNLLNLTKADVLLALYQDKGLTPDDIKAMLKDPYIFDMLTFTKQYNERDVEIGLVSHVEKFLIEMGAGFAFMGRQYHIEVSGDDYYIDILMYNTFLHRYLVIELKDTEFMPEYIGKLNFYCSAVDDILCREGDNRTIGLLLCKTKDRIKAEYALRDIQKPIGISDYELGQALPKDFRGSLPTIEEIEKELEIK